MATSRERLKRALVAGVVHSPLVRLPEMATRGLATVFLCHRFDLDGERSSDRTSTLRDVLEWLRRNRYELVSIERVVRAHLGEEPPLERAVAFTIDDGYADQADAAESVFADFDCPVTIFLTTGFVDGELVPWWDRLAAVVAAAAGDRLQNADVDVDLPLDGPTGRLHALHRLEERCKTLDPVARDELIAALARGVGVEPLKVPHPSDRPLTWERARRLEQTGLVRFGPHSVTHPILSRCDDRQAEEEIVRSWRRVRDELQHPLPIFCYPNGEASDFGDREVEIVRRAGMIGAVTVEVGHADPRRHDPFHVRRVPFLPEPLDDLQWVAGLEQLRRRPPHRR